MHSSRKEEDDELDWEDEDDSERMATGPSRATAMHDSGISKLENLEQAFAADLRHMKSELHEMSSRDYEDSDDDVSGNGQEELLDHRRHRGQDEPEDSELWAENFANSNGDLSKSANESNPFLFGARPRQEIRESQSNLIDVSHRDLEEEDSTSHSNSFAKTPLTGSDAIPQIPLSPVDNDHDDDHEEDDEDEFISDGSTDTLTSDRQFDPHEAIDDYDSEIPPLPPPPQFPRNTSRRSTSNNHPRGTSLLLRSRRKSPNSTGSTNDFSSDDDPLLVVDKTPNMISDHDSTDSEQEDGVLLVDDPDSPPRSTGEPDRLRQSSRSGRDCCIGCAALCCIFLLLAAAIGLPLYFLRDPDPDIIDQPTGIPTPAPTGFVVALPPYTLAAMEDNIFSPQAKAYDWLLQDPNLLSYSEARKLQRFALVAIYYGLRGENWTTADRHSWLNYTVSECTWGFRGNTSGFHTQCSEPEDQEASTTKSSNIFEKHLRQRTRELQTADEPELTIVALNIPSSNAVGILPPEIQMLSNLQTLDLGDNTIFGTLPTQMAAMHSLVTLNMTLNLLTGSIPWLSSPLEKIDMSHNQLNSNLPPWMAGLSTLEYLDLSYNNFTGPFVVSTSSWGKTLKHLSLHDNQLTGRVPTEVGLLSTLEDLEMDHNQLNGTLPTQIGALSMLRKLMLYDNDLSGPVPTEVGNLTQLREIGWTGNRLNETLPSELGLLTLLESLWIYGNEFTGTIPPQLGNLTDFALMHFILYDNRITGVVPNQLCGIEMLQFDCGRMCGCDCRTSCNSTNGNFTDEEDSFVFTIGIGDGREIVNGTVDEPPDLGKEDLYGIRKAVHSWGSENITLQYALSDYILDDSIDLILYDGIKCRNGSADITATNTYLKLELKTPTDDGPKLGNEGRGTRQFDLLITLIPDKVSSAPFFTKDSNDLESGELAFCVGLSVDYNRVDGWTGDVEVNAVELAVTVDLANGTNINGVSFQAVIVPQYGFQDTAEPNPCTGKDPKFLDVPCVNEGAGEQSPVNVTSGYKGLKYTTAIPLKSPFLVAGLCPINVNWRLGAEHYSLGEYDENGVGPISTIDPSSTRLGYQCKYYDASDARFTKEYNWNHCQDMQVGQTYEIQWPHSAAGACGTEHQYQTPLEDGLFCKEDIIVSTAAQIGFQAQIFTVINDEEFYYPDLISGMITEGEWGSNLTMYTGSTTGTARDMEMCSAYTPVTWHVDRVCHLISASSFEKLCADMKEKADDMSEDLLPHGARKLVEDSFAANNHVN